MFDDTRTIANDNISNQMILNSVEPLWVQNVANRIV